MLLSPSGEEWPNDYQLFNIETSSGCETHLSQESRKKLTGSKQKCGGLYEITMIFKVVRKYLHLKFVSKFGLWDN